MVSFEEATVEELENILKQYIDYDYWELNDFPTIIERARVIEERKIVEFKLSFMDLYLDTRDLEFVDVHPYFQ